MYSFTTNVRYSELAEDKKLSLVAIINYFQDACNFESEFNDVGLKWLSEHGTAWVLTSWQIKIDKRPRLGDEITVNTWACGFKKFIGLRNFTISDKDGNIIIYALSNWAYINMKDASPATVPEKELEVYGTKEPLDREFVKGKIKLPEELTKHEPIEIRKINIDTNHHVNNAQYIALAEEYLPDGFVPTGLRAEYKNQALLGEKLHPKVASTETAEYVVFEDADGNVKLVTEFAR